VVDLTRVAPAERAGSIFLGLALTALWTWWALAEGAFFGSVLFAGGIVLLLVLMTMLGFAPLKISAGGPHEVAFLALISLALWTLVSIAWTPARDLALEYSERTLLYAAAFAAGLWLTNLLSRRMALAVLPLAIAGAVVCLVTIVTAWTADSAATLFDEENTLDFPFGYRNAQACFLVMIMMLGTAIAARARGPVALRCAGAGLGAMAGSLMLLSQSRGSVVGVAAGVVVFLLVSPLRSRALVALAVVAAPVLLSLPWMLEPFDVAGADGDPLDALRSAATAAVLAGAAAAVVMFGITRMGEALPDIDTVERGTRRALLGLLVAGLLAIPIGIAVTGADPVGWVDDKLTAEEGESSGTSNSRFLYTGGLQRTDYWSVAFDQFTDSPFAGGGAGSFRSRYLQDRDSDQSPREAHSVEMEMLGELGAPGFLLLAIALGAAVVGGLRSRRLGPEAAFLTTAALTVGAVYFAHSSIDWFWSFAGLGAPVLALLGSAVAPQAYALREAASRRRRGIAMVATVAVILTLVPIWLSERLTVRAAESWGADLGAARSALDRAADLNPLADTPMLVEAEIARQLEDIDAALEALEQARTRQPTEYFNYEIAAQVLAKEDPQAALEEAELGLELNPRSQVLTELSERLRKRTGE
jgi:hypothetical protein